MGRLLIPQEERNQIAVSYRSGSTTLQLADRYHVSEGAIRKILKRSGEVCRPRSERARLAHQARGYGCTPLLEKYVKDGRLVVGPEEWAKTRANYGEDVLARSLCHVLGTLPLPYPDIDQAKGAKAFQDLQEASTASLFGVGKLRLLRCPETDQYGYHTALKPPGNAASNFLFCSQRWSTPGNNYPSIVERWADPKLRYHVCRRFLRMKACDRVSPSVIRGALCVTGSTPSQFKPGTAKGLYELVGAQDILDFSAGWGDRLVGFCAAAGARSYTGIDPNSALHPLYRRAAELYAGTKAVRMIDAPAEEVILGPESFDLVFTSPPYFHAERYAAGQEHAGRQSWSRYPSPERWYDAFLAPVVRNAWSALRLGGVLAVNLADIRLSGGAWVPLCQGLRDLAASLPGAIAHPVLGMRLQGSNYAPETREAKSGEPIWLWSKGPSGRIPEDLFVHRTV
jgi:hypothetical protein